MPSTERFAYPVSTIDDLALPVRSALAEHLLPGETIRQIIFAPRQDRPVRRDGLLNWPGYWLLVQQTPAWVLALTMDRLLVATLVEPASRPQITVTPLADLLWLEVGKILLYSWFEWSWATPGGPQRQQVYFNTVSEDLFRKLANAVRRTIIAQAGLPQPVSKRGRGGFDELPYKFRNLIPQKLLFRDEQAQVIVYQPAIWGRRWGLFRHQRAAATVVVLSPDHLLVVQDDLSEGRATYGIIVRYCPSGRLRGAALERAGDDLRLQVTLSVRETKETLRLLFEPGAEPALQALLAQIAARGGAAAGASRERTIE